MNYLFSVGASICLFTIILLTSGKKKISTPTKGAIILLTLWIIRFALIIIQSTIDLKQLPYLITFGQNLFFLDGILLHFYIESFSNKTIQNTRYLGLIPFLLFFGLSNFSFFYYGGDEIYRLYKENKTLKEAGNYDVNYQEIIFFVILALFNLFYLTKSVRALKKYSKSLYDNFSNLNKLGVRWIKRLLIFWIFFMFIPLIVFSIDYVFKLSNPVQVNFIFLTGMIFTAVYFSYNVLNQSYSENLFITPDKDTTPNTEINEETKVLASQLEALLKVQKVFTDSNLSLDKLSELLSCKPGQSTLAIKSLGFKNFYECINHYRIEAIKMELLETDEQIIIIAYNNGFNSKSTFNTAFKNMTQTTPSRFRKEFKS